MSKYLELVEGSFTQEHFDKQKSQNPYVAYSIKDDEVIYYKLQYIMYKIINKDISNCTYNMVDLGLSVKWADRNVGASSPEDYGSYFQWGDTTPYTFNGVGEVTAAELVSLLQSLIGDEVEITKDDVRDILKEMGITGTGTDITPLGSSSDKEFNWDSYFDTSDGGSTFNKYNNNGGLTVLESSDDAATVYMGSNYRTPTHTESKELFDNTTLVYIDLNGSEYSKDQVYNGAIAAGNLKGVRLISNINGNSIFLPAAGFCVESLLLEACTGVYCWCSSLNDGSDDGANNIDGSITPRWGGVCIRGVQA